MSLSMHSASIPYFVRALNNLFVILKKGAAHAEEREIDPSIFVAGRLFPDMLPLSRQVQIACDVSKLAAARISGIQAPSFEDNEQPPEEYFKDPPPTRYRRWQKTPAVNTEWTNRPLVNRTEFKRRRTIIQEAKNEGKKNGSCDGFVGEGAVSAES